MEAQTEARSFHWGLVSKYRTEIMGFACIWIMLSHNFCIWPESMGWYWVKRIFQFGNLGVELFLIVSGIGLYFAWQNRKSLGQFYQRRYVRLLIPYFLIAVPYWIWLDLHVGGLDWSCFLLDFTQLSLPFRGVITTWYIPASAVFYLLFPLIYYVQNGTWAPLEGVPIRKISRETRTVLLMLAAFALLIAVRQLARPVYEHCEIAISRAIIFVVGVYLGRLVMQKAEIPGWCVLASGCFICMYFPFREMNGLYDFWIRLSYIPFGLSVCIFVTWVLNWQTSLMLWLRRLLCFFGKRSIELYLSHVLLKNVYLHYKPVDLWDRHGILSYMLVVIAAVIVSVILHPIIEWISKKLL